MSDVPEKMIRSEIYDSVPLGAKADPWPIICPVCEGLSISEYCKKYNVCATVHLKIVDIVDGEPVCVCSHCDGKGTVIV